MDYLAHFRNRLEAIYARGLRRSLKPRAREALNFSSNDYLNLAHDPRLKAAASRATEEYGCGSTASRLMAGHLPLHEELESALAHLVHQESALVFPSGYQMNVAVISALFDENWTIYSDALNHASLIDGCRLSSAQVDVFSHRDVNGLAARLKSATGLKAILTESVFSMDGDLAPIAELSALARAHDAMLIVDEAHAIGIHGAGAGVCGAQGVVPQLVLGTLGKALGSAGGFAATSGDIRDFLINSARGFIFSTGLAPGAAGAALEAVRIVQHEHSLGSDLLLRARHFRECLRQMDIEVPMDESAIVPVILGDNGAAVQAATELRSRGILVHGIRPPTVPEGTSRLRLSVTLGHSEEELSATAEAIADVLSAEVTD